jgi:threonine dehydratase
MAKKAAKKATKKTAKPAKKSTAKAAKKPAKKVEHVEIQLTAAELAALDLTEKSDEVCQELEDAVTVAICGTLRKVFKKHKIVLSESEAMEVAAALFGDE